ncbi:MAG TPA: T9SS type A sorting domain-containing protein [Ignavibacteria bacterium]|nr:T9SS type A sorting domain-containing protein [Ignavibacteria bacterium]
MKCYKLIVFSLLTFLLPLSIFSQAVPEILYYKFNTGTTSTPNLAFPGQGTPEASIVGAMTMGPGGQFGNALIGAGGTGSTTYLNTGWNMNLGASSWTISLWLNNMPTTTVYLFGNDITTSFRCFTNGAAGAGNITLRASAPFANVNVTGVLPGPNVIHFVYDATVPDIKTYVNGVFQSSTPQPALNLNAAIPFKVGGYGTASSIPNGALIDEFRFYSRALGSSEIASTWNVELPVGGGVTNPTQVCDYGLIPQYPGGALGGHASATLGDTLYIAGGSVTTGAITNPPASVTVTRYAINSGVWSAGRDMPGPKVGGDLVKCGNSLYYIGGGAITLTGVANADIYKYDPAAGWTTVANIPTPVTGVVAECWGDSVIYAIMGGWTQYYRGIQIYRPGTNTWSRANDSIPATFGRRSFAGGLSGNKIFVGAGFSGAFRKDFWIGTIGPTAETITWAQGPSVPTRGTGNSRPGGTAVNGRFYVIPGENSPAPNQLDSIFIWSVDDSLWLPQVLTGRGANTSSNYWGVVSSSIVNNKVKIWIPGGFFPSTVTTTKLFCLTDSLGCIVTNNENTASVLPDGYELKQNYPNPFNPVTRISYALPKNGFVKLKIYDISGKLVAQLVNQSQTAGNYIVDFDASRFASGTYFYKLESENFVDTKKMILLK